MKKNLKSDATGDFLFEVGCEEIPARLIPKACSELQQILEKYLSASAILAEPLRAFGAPRRLTVMSDAVRLRQSDQEKEILGPPKSIAFDNVGAPTRAAVSFSEKQGIPLAKLKVVTTPRGEFLAAKQTIVGRSAKEILGEILPQALRELPFPRSMYWTGRGGVRFIRPVRWIVALLDGAVVPVEFGGASGTDRSHGHRFLARGPVRISGTKDYTSRLRKAFVLADPAERQRKIEQELRGIAAKRKWRVHEDAGLLELVTNLNEYPTVISGDFAAEFLELPAEILITVMRDHQKYFAVENSHGEIEPHFLAVINLDKDSAGLVRAGHERVLRARLADARFFWEADQKSKLGSYGEKLAHITFESRLGTYGDKTARIRDLARWIAGNWFDSGLRGADVAAADRAAELAKCDLATEMVREFTELQGIVGGLYARAQREEEEIACAIYDHYKPAGTEDSIPRNMTGCAVSIADKLDSLVACFAVGILPTGSSDPFALRRAASGIVQIILELKTPLSLSAAISAAAKALVAHKPKITLAPESESAVLDFILERAKYLLREKQGFAYDEVNAAMAASADDLVDARSRIVALQAIRRTRNFEPLAIAFKRIHKILGKAGKDGVGAKTAAPELFKEVAERNLYHAAEAARARVAEHKRAGQYREALEAIADLRPAVDRFFDEVLVMAEDEAVRKNRLGLLAMLRKEFSTIADFSLMVPDEG
ncbi:MAG TPA: glycine--tRNA ligase subunit beta [Candidatus Acidoferrales bacterium]|nr:glycine--tRNA ligase subunit beta [Candidatus Acidoferrales bacterium]